MLTARCPHCGAPARVVLVHDHVDCGHCGERFAFEGEIEARVVAARALIASLDVRRRQLTETERRALGRAGFAHGCFVLVLVVLALAFGVPIAMLGSAFFDPGGPPPLGQVAWFFLPPVLVFVVFVVPSIAYDRSLRRRRRVLEDACAAVPPEGPGQPATCHLCGAPLLHSKTSEGIVRCASCAADNVVDPVVLARAARRETATLDDFEAEVKAHGTSTAGAALRGVTLLPVYGVLVLAATCFAWAFALVKAVDVEGPIDDTVDLGLATTDVGRCFVDRAIARARGDAVVGFSPVDPRSLVGRELVLGADVRRPDADRILVEHVYSSPFIPSAIYVRVKTERGTVERIALASNVCEP